MEYKNYNTDLKNLKATLDTYGVAVLPNLLNEQEIKAMQEGMWSMLEYLTEGKFEVSIEETKPESWKTFYSLLPLHSMMLKHQKVGHAQFVWDLRQNPKIVAIFANLWNVQPDQLIASYDGMSIHLPPETTGQGWYKSGDWLHTDQSLKRNGFECIQSFICGYDTNPGDATLTILEGSHKYHLDLAKTLHLDTLKTTDKKAFDKLSKDWYKLCPTEKQFYLEKGCKQYCVQCSAGSLVLWDSRTIHAAIEAQKTRKIPNIRLVVYLCYTERKRATKAILEKRIKYFETMRMTSHGPHKINVVPETSQFGTLPEVNDLPEPELTELGRKLVGY